MSKPLDLFLLKFPKLRFAMLYKEGNHARALNHSFYCFKVTVKDLKGFSYLRNDSDCIMKEYRSYDLILTMSGFNVLF